MKIKLTENINNILLLIAVFIGLDGLGLGVSIRGFEIMGISIAHILILFIVIISFTVSDHRVFNMENDISLPMILLFGLFLVEFLISTIYILFIEQSYPMGQLIKNVLELYIYFFFFSIILLVTNKKQLMKFIYGLLIITVISAFICYYQAVNKISLSASVMRDSGQYVRFYFPTLHLIAGVFFTIVALYLYYGFKKSLIPVYLIGVFALPAFFIPLHRGMISAFLIVLLGLLIFNLKDDFKKGLGLLIFLCFFFIIVVMILRNIGVDFNAIWARIKDGWISTLNQEGTAGFRFLLIKVAWKDTMNNSPIFGIGFTWRFISSLEDYLTTASQRSPVNDSSYSSLITTFGLSGIFVYVFLFYRVFKTGFKVLNKSIEKDYRCMIIGVLSLNVYLLIVGISSDLLFGQSSTTVMVASWAVLYIIANFNAKEKNMEGR